MGQNRCTHQDSAHQETDLENAHGDGIKEHGAIPPSECSRWTARWAPFTPVWNERGAFVLFETQPCMGLQARANALKSACNSGVSVSG